MQIRSQKADWFEVWNPGSEASFGFTIKTDAAGRRTLDGPLPTVSGGTLPDGNEVEAARLFAHSEALRMGLIDG